MNTVEKYKKYVNTAFVKAVEPVVVAKAKGAQVWGEDGKAYTDLFAGISVVNAGHGNPEVIAAAKAQMDQLVHCCTYVYHVPAAADLAEKLAQVTPGRLQKTFFGNGGAEANEGAMRLAKQFTKAFIAEPVMGEGGIVTPPPGYFEAIKQVLDHHGILLFVDEVQSGFGRTGKLFAIQHWDVEPDILTMAKGIADGFPLSGFIAREEIADSFRPGDHLSTFGGNPVSCAAALANIAYFEKEQLCDQSAAKGKMLMGALKDLQKRQPLIGDVRGLGLMIGVELVRDAKKTPATEEAGKVKNLMRERGFLIGVGGTWGNVLRIQPPLIIGQADLLKAVDALGECLGGL